MHYDPLPTSPSEAPCKGKINDRFWVRSNFSLEGDCDFHSNIDSPSPIRDRRMGEGREGGSLLLPPNPHVDLGRPTGLPLCPLGRGAACAKVGKGVKNNIPNIGWNKTLRVFGPGLCPSDAKGAIHIETITSGARPLGSSCNDPHPASPERARRSGEGRGGDEITNPT